MNCIGKPGRGLPILVGSLCSSRVGKSQQENLFDHFFARTQWWQQRQDNSFINNAGSSLTTCKDVLETPSSYITVVLPAPQRPWRSSFPMCLRSIVHILSVYRSHTFRQNKRKRRVEGRAPNSSGKHLHFPRLWGNAFQVIELACYLWCAFVMHLFEVHYGIL